MIDFVVDAAAVHRLTRLVTRDTISRPIRARLIRWAYLRAYEPGNDWALSEDRTEAEWDQLPHDDDDAPKLAAFVVCPWCVGLWISVGVAAARRYTPNAWAPIARPLALSTAAALIAGHEVDR